MKVLIYLASPPLESTLGHHLDIALDEIQKGNEVFLLSCDNSIGSCMENPKGSRLYCKLCTLVQQNCIKKYLPKNIEHHWMSEYVEKIDKVSLPKFNYTTADELRYLTYNGIDIGFGVMSTYISLTRNLNPRITEKSRVFFDFLIQEQLITLEIVENLHKEYNFGLVIFQNGRGAQLKPFLNFCQREKIDFWCTEAINKYPECYKNDFWNDIPHSIKGNTMKYGLCWENSKDTLEEKIKIGQSFFENRRNAKPTNDKVFITAQKAGELPADWDSSVKNIVIFNSSEDEYSAVSHEFDSGKVFKNQIDGIKAIAEHYSNDNTKHFTLRVHPNLNKISYKYHKDLYNLNYSNLTVIPGTSSVSTYSLMDAADIIIVFGSTTGIESAYWGKPVICLGPSLYRNLGVVYLPNTPEDLWSLIETENLKPLYNEKILTYGYFYMSRNHQKTNHINMKIQRKKLFGKILNYYSYNKILGSAFMYAVLCRLFRALSFKIKLLPSKIKEIPTEEA